MGHRQEEVPFIHVYLLRAFSREKYLYENLA